MLSIVDLEKGLKKRSNFLNGKNISNLNLIHKIQLECIWFEDEADFLWFSLKRAYWLNIWFLGILYF